MPDAFDAPGCSALPLPINTLTDSVLILVVLNVVQKLIGFVRATLFCRWLNAEQLGQWDMAFSFLSLIAPVAILAIPGAFGRHLEYFRQRGQLRMFMRRTGLACGLLAVVACLSIVTARRQFSLLIFGSTKQTDVIGVAAGCLLIVVAFNFLVELLIALRSVRLASIMQLINSVVFAVLGVSLLFGWQCSAKSVLLAYGGSCLAAVVWAIRPLRRMWLATPPAAEPMPPAMLWGRIAPYAAWVLLFSTLANVFGLMDRYMIVHFSRLPSAGALDLVGNYHSSRLVPLLLISLAMLLGTMMMPHLSHDWEAGRRDRVAFRLRLFLKVFGFALLAAGTVVLAAAPLLFGVAFRGKFPGGQAVLPLTLVYCTWFSLAMIAQCYLLCAEKAYLVCVSLASGLALNVTLNVFLLPRLGLEGAVLATAGANSLMLLLVCWFNRRLGFRLDDGAKLVLVLPMLLCLGPWVSMLAIALVAADAVWGRRLLSPEEKHELAEGIADYVKRIGLSRRFAAVGRRAVGR